IDVFHTGLARGELLLLYAELQLSRLCDLGHNKLHSGLVPSEKLFMMCDIHWQSLTWYPRFHPASPDQVNMAPTPSSLCLCVCNQCTHETLPTYGNNQLKELVFGRYQKKNSATHKQHLKELNESGRTALSSAITDGSEWANQQTSGIIINDLQPNNSKGSSGNVLSAAHTNCSESVNQNPSGIEIAAETRDNQVKIKHFYRLLNKGSIHNNKYYAFQLRYTNATLWVLKEITTLENSNNNPDIRFPITIETIISHLHLTPKIHTQTCCPQCFSLYRTDNTPSQCSFRATPKSLFCESLLLVSTHQKGDKTNAKPGKCNGQG
ncbi:hypothetical protein VP01_6283g1, partial [Puccinia sorghi]